MIRTVPSLALAALVILGMSACGTTEPNASTPGLASSPTTPAPTTPAPTTPAPPTPSPSTPSPSTSTAPTTTSTPAAAAISVSGFAFTVPASVAPGATVTVRNDDSEAHTVTSRKGGFDVKVDPGRTVTFTAPTAPGSYPFVCSFHDMSATLVVR